MRLSSLKNLAAAGFIFMIAACNSQKEANKSISVVQSPSPTLEKKYNELMVENGLSKTSFKLSDGTEIEIPDSAFVDAEGNLVKEKVALKFKKYDDAVDVLGSGIPMEYDSAGVAEILQTAGMFEIYGKDSNGKDVFINTGKKINVKTISNISDPDYNFYVYDTLKSNWKYVGQSEMVKQEPVVKNYPGQPMAPQKYDPDRLVLDMKLNYEEFVELSSMKNIMWQYAGEKEGEEKIEAGLKKKWNNVKLDLIDGNKSLFKMTLSNNQESMDALVVPVLAGKGYDRAMIDYNKKMEAYKIKYADRIAKEEAERKSLTTVYRTVGISSFGKYNHDKIMRNSNPVITAVFQDENGNTIENATVYHLYGAAATVIRYPSDRCNSFRFTKEGGNCLVAFLENGKALVFNNNDFSKLDAKKIKQQGTHTFKMNSASSQSLDADELRKLIRL